MIRPDPEVIEMMAKTVRQFPPLLEWLNQWYHMELERLPTVGPSNVALAQGRCQVLAEVVSLLSKSPDIAAQPHER